MAVSFDNVAPYYDTLVRLIFGKAVHKAQTCFLDQIPDQATVLILGGGTGWVLREVLQRKPGVQIDYVDASAAMVHLARKRGTTQTSAAQVRFICGTEADLPPEAKYDAILTFFVLDVQPNDAALCATTKTLYQHLKKPGLWLFADFRPQKIWWHTGMVRLMFLFFRLTANFTHDRLPAYDQAFAQLGLCQKQSALFYGRLIGSAVYRAV